MVKLSVVIPAYNEESVVRRKLRDLYATSLSPDLFEVLVGSDGSMDLTADVVRGFCSVNRIKNLRLYEFENRGKAATLTHLVRECNGDIILASDADSTFADPGLFKHLLERFEGDPALGGISCVPIFSANAIENGYWRTEHAIRQFLSRRGSLFVVTGMGFAFRKSACDPIPADVMADDLWMPLSIIKNGYRVMSDDRFRARTEIFKDERELKRKIRVVKGGMQCLFRFFTAHPRMIPTPVFGWVLLFKVSKWCLPLLAIAALGALATAWWPGAVAIGVFVFVTAGVSRPVRYTVLGILLPAAAFWEAVRGKYEPRWGHAR